MQLGDKPNEPGTRDAMHVAVMSVTSDDHVGRDQHVCFVEGSTSKVRLVEPIMTIPDGVVDPYAMMAHYQQYYDPGTPFNILVNPAKITAVRHAFDLVDEPKTGINAGAADELCEIKTVEIEDEDPDPDYEEGGPGDWCNNDPSC